MQPSANPQMHLIDLEYRGASLQVEYYFRPGRRIPLLYLHGLGCSARDFAGAAQYAGLNGYPLIAPNLPGSGRSAYFEHSTPALDDICALLELFARELSLQKFVLIGHSMGGTIGLLYASTHSRARGFINVEGNLTAENCTFSRLAVRPNYASFRQRGFSRLIRRISKEKNAGLQQYAKSLQSLSNIRAYYDFSRSLVQYSDSGRLLPLFTALRVPAAYIYGAQNAWFSYLGALARGGCTLIEIPESDHFPMYDNPEAFYEAVAHFAGTLEARQSI